MKHEVEWFETLSGGKICCIKGRRVCWHCEDGPAWISKDGIRVWYWEDCEFGSEPFDESWPDDKKAWWMRAKLSQNNL